MDVLRFVNSGAVREHLRKIGYRFSSLEAAWLIWQCRSATIEEKHRAWEELIETMPDCPIEARRNTAPQESLHGFLKEYMALEDRYVEEFYEDHHTDTYDSDKPYVYKFRYVYKDGGIFDFPSVSSAFDALYETIMEPDEDVVEIRGERMRVDRVGSSSYARLTPSLEFMDIDRERLDSTREEEIFWDVFIGLWFDFPTPFQKGDIVWDPKHPAGTCGGPFVLTGAGLDGIESERVRENIQKDGDNTDMTAGGYFVSGSTGIYPECMSNYMDLEYYDKELTGGERVLVPLSNFLKGRISPELYARAYHQILMEEHARMCMPKDHLKGELILAGLEKAEHVKLWLDDIREAPEGYTPCKSVNEAKKIITGWERDGAVIDVIDCDHDLGDYASDGGDGIVLLDWLAERESFYPIELHTMNPVGRENMQREIDRYWKKENL